ncbi:MAG: F0F1 ATP synthase subunit delta [Pedosphaera parvula]|nr:F0F1 ATP synthase subunit delta [Pedosphaera parvula]
MKISKQARRDAKQLFRSCQVNGLLDEQRVRQVVPQVIARKPRGFVSILSHFQRLVKMDVARRTAKVESAIALPAALRQGVQANLTRLYGEGLNLSFAQNAALIGGLRVQVGSDVYDGSVQARLAALGEKF